MNGESGLSRHLERLEIFLVWLLVAELGYAFILIVIALIAWPSDAVWNALYDHDQIRAGALFPLIIAFVFNLGAALWGLILYALERENLNSQILRPGFIFNWVIVAALGVPYLILLLQIAFNILGRVKFFETYF
jgi:hypothetical protein